MSDFLSNLVDRNLNTTRVVQPRLASLFEPVPTGTEIGFEPVLQVETGNDIKFYEEQCTTSPQQNYRDSRSMENSEPTSSVRSPDSTAISPLHKTELNSTISLLSHSLRVQPSDLLNNQPIMRSQRNEAIAPSSQLLPISSSAASSDSSFGSSNTSVSPVPTSSQPVIAPPSSEALSTQKNTAKLTDWQSVEQSIEPSGVIPTQLPEFHPNSSRVQRSESSSEGRIQIQPQIRSLVEPTLPKRSQPTDTPQSPTINVTIGRIEVRMTPTVPSSSSKQQTKAPAMNLEQYLRQRSGGGR